MEEDDDELAAMIAELKAKKKKKGSQKMGVSQAVSSEAPPVASAPPVSAPAIAVPVPSPEEDRAFYGVMLARLYTQLRQNNPELVDRSVSVLRKPDVVRAGARVIWINFDETCQLMKRDREHVALFYQAELGTAGSIDGRNRLLLKGSFSSKYIKTLLRVYVKTYVTCENCHGVRTVLMKDPATRVTFLVCEVCEARRSVPLIQKGYRAVAKGERGAARLGS